MPLPSPKQSSQVVTILLLEAHTQIEKLGVFCRHFSEVGYYEEQAGLKNNTITGILVRLNVMLKKVSPLLFL